MNTYFSMNTLKSVTEHLPEKLIASAGVTGIASALGIHACCVALSALLWRRMYGEEFVLNH